MFFLLTLLEMYRIAITNLTFIYRKSSIRSRPLIQVYSIRGRVIGGSVQALIIGKSLNHSKLPYLEHYGLVEKKICSRNYNFLNTSNTSLGKLGFKIIQGRLLIEDLRYMY